MPNLLNQIVLTFVIAPSNRLLLKLLLCFGLWLIIAGSTRAQDVAINNVIATDFITSDQDILEISFIDQLPNLPFILAWMNEANQQFAIQLITQEDDLVINMSRQNGWSGKIQMVGISLENVEAQIRKPNFQDDLKLFLTTNIMTPGSINFSGAYFLNGKPLRHWLLLAILLIAGICFVFTRQFRMSLFIGMLIAIFLYDARGIKNRWDIMTQLKKDDYQINIYTDLDVFIQEARDIIGEETWSKDQLSGVLNSYCTYQLADLQYLPPSLRSNARYIITNNPKGRPVVLNRGAYFLVQN